MFNKYTLIVCALFAGVFAAPLSKTPSQVQASAVGSGTCDVTALQSKITDMQDVAKEILSVGIPLRDTFRVTAADAATFDTVVTAINDAATAAAANDFATTSTKISFIVDKVTGLFGDKDQNVSAIDLELFADARAATALVNVCNGGAAPAVAAAIDAVDATDIDTAPEVFAPPFDGTEIAA
ncbi:hypothetical protein B0H15DRAFT_951759 [Mycena belliarum]|uniref:Uncharacterized protein n=1 Tax=Mycena belliarum TaxID=1033014 RepID=A0AAD6TYF2_9AGAR|nr:hypothetical protein B0H15DRAFT_951759 [Mycena belliae]